MSLKFTRRAFTAMLPTVSLVGCQNQTISESGNSTPALSAGDVVDRIHNQLRAEGIEVLPHDKTADRIVVGDRDVPVTGIATTFMSNFETMRRARDAGLSFIISHEPTFWHHLDNTQGLEDDPTYMQKRAFAEENGMVVFRFHDHWHMRRPEPISQAFYQKLGAENNEGLVAVLEMPPMRLADLVAHMEEALGTSNLRYWGDPDRVVSRVRWGGHLLSQVAGVDTEVFIWPEPKEFNTFDYFRDAQELGLNGSIIGATHELAEEWGMLAPCADWVRTIVPEVPVQGVRTQELYRTM